MPSSGQPHDSVDNTGVVVAFTFEDDPVNVESVTTTRSAAFAMETVMSSSSTTVTVHPALSKRLYIHESIKLNVLESPTVNNTSLPNDTGATTGVAAHSTAASNNVFVSEVRSVVVAAYCIQVIRRPGASGIALMTLRSLSFSSSTKGPKANPIHHRNPNANE